MNVRHQVYEFVNLVKVFRDGRQESVRMTRWVAELELGCISYEQPDVTRARIESIEIDPKAPYPARPVNPQQMREIALYLATFLAAPLVA